MTGTWRLGAQRNSKVRVLYFLQRAARLRDVETTDGTLQDAAGRSLETNSSRESRETHGVIVQHPSRPCRCRVPCALRKVLAFMMRPRESDNMCSSRNPGSHGSRTLERRHPRAGAPPLALHRARAEHCEAYSVSVCGVCHPSLVKTVAQVSCRISQHSRRAARAFKQTGYQ
jgi:hypothetical protein